MDAAGHANSYAAEFRRWLEVSGLSRGALAKRIGYDRTYISKIVSGSEPGSINVARAADSEMKTGGSLARLYETEHSRAARAALRSTGEARVDGTDLVVDIDDATLRYENGIYRLTQRRRLTNYGVSPVTRYLIRIAVDKYPGRPEVSNAFYRESPLTWEMLDLKAWWGEDRSDPITWSAQHDRDAFKEVWLTFEGSNGERHDLFPGESGWIEYAYTVPETHWGDWFRRAVRLPTHRLSVTLDFPEEVRAAVWGLHTSMSGDHLPLDTPIVTRQVDDRRVSTWATRNPALHVRYTFKWTFREGTTTPPTTSAAEAMTDLGIVQDDSSILRAPVRRFDLPGDKHHALEILAQLRAAAERIADVHDFAKGRGVAAPQIGASRAAVVMYPPGTSQPIELLNPVIIDASEEGDQQYEGCLSFFDVRCKIPRPLRIDVEHYDITGKCHITTFEKGLARLVAHEIDHLDGILCKDLLPEGEFPVPVEVYRGTGNAWSYGRA